MTNVSGTLQNIYIQNILPEVITRKMKNTAPKIFNGQKDKLYCFCNSPYSSDETWIGCHSEKSNWEWFHSSYVNLKRVPRNNWYCSVCLKEKYKMAETCDAKNKKRKRRYIWKYSCFYWVKVFTQTFTILWIKYLGNKSDFTFHNSSHKSAEYLVLVLRNWQELCYFNYFLSPCWWTFHFILPYTKVY